MAVENRLRLYNECRYRYSGAILSLVTHFHPTPIRRLLSVHVPRPINEPCPPQFSLFQPDSTTPDHDIHVELRGVGTFLSLPIEGYFGNISAERTENLAR